MTRFFEKCLQVLTEPNPRAKAALALAIDISDADNLAKDQSLLAPDYPARPANIKTVQPGKVSKRKWGSEQARLPLLHAIAHIELNAIDLAFDMIVRFGCTAPIAPKWTTDFCTDWLRVGQEEAKHFGLIADLMAERNMQYGDLPVHAGMWDAAISTSDRVDARLAIAPLVLEARGLDVTPPMIKKLQQANDQKAVEILQLIYEEEVGHVAIGVKWFDLVCEELSLEPVSHFKQMLASRFTASLKPPFNVAARNEAGLKEEFYS